MFKYTRNPNYLGEILIYTAFGICINNVIILCMLLIIYITVFYQLMRKKDASLSKQPN